MRDAAEIYLWGTRIGAVWQPDDHACVSFEYDHDFLRSGVELSPLHVPLADTIRSVIRIFTEIMLPFFIFIIPFGIWGAIVCIFLFLTGVVTMFLAPFNLLLHLVLGIIQSIMLIRDRI